MFSSSNSTTPDILKGGLARLTCSAQRQQGFSPVEQKWNSTSAIIEQQGAKEGFELEWRNEWGEWAKSQARVKSREKTDKVLSHSQIHFSISVYFILEETDGYTGKWDDTRHEGGKY